MENRGFRTGRIKFKFSMRQPCKSIICPPKKIMLKTLRASISHVFTSGSSSLVVEQVHILHILQISHPGIGATRCFKNEHAYAFALGTHLIRYVLLWRDETPVCILKSCANGDKPRDGGFIAYAARFQSCSILLVWKVAGHQYWTPSVHVKSNLQLFWFVLFR